MRIENMIDKRTKRYPVEFKAEAVRLLLTSGKSQAQLGSELGVPGPTLGKWKGQAIRNGDHPTPNIRGLKLTTACSKPRTSGSHKRTNCCASRGKS
jgi:transposase-like protein